MVIELDTPLVIVAAVAVYLAPTVIAAVRRSPRLGQVLVLGLALGWTGVGWLMAWWPALRSSRRTEGAVDEAGRRAVAASWRPGRPEAAIARVLPSGLYGPGAFLLSERHGAQTWLVCTGAGWALSYELDGTQRLVGWIDDTDVPLELRALALCSDASQRGAAR